MKTEILTVGDEILIGQIVDTNSSWIASRLIKESINVSRMISLGDKREEMLQIIGDAFERADLIVVTGGLGPTKDDITKDILGELFQTGWRWDEKALEMIKDYYVRRNREPKEINLNQAYLPDACETIYNEWGSAPGMLFRKEGKMLVSLPGVPYEMSNMFENKVLPEIKSMFKTGQILKHHFLVINIPESVLSEKLSDIEDYFPSYIKLAYLPNLSQVRLRLTCFTEMASDAEQLFHHNIEKIRTYLGDAIVTEEDITFEEFLYKLMSQHKLSLSLAESCTGGFVSQKFTSIPGISSVYMGGVVAYSYDAKSDLLGVNMNDIQMYGAVSEEIVTQMAVGCCKKFKTDFSIAISGIAGPDGGTIDKPVGTVWVAVCYPSGCVTKRFQFQGSRIRIIEQTFLSSVEMLRQQIYKHLETVNP
jgi:nicotinamide-nucleotide amidase